LRSVAVQALGNLVFNKVWKQMHFVNILWKNLNAIMVLKIAPGEEKNPLFRYIFYTFSAFQIVFYIFPIKLLSVIKFGSS